MQSSHDASLCNGKDHATAAQNEPHRLNQPPPFVVHPLVTNIRCQPDRLTSLNSPRNALEYNEQGKSTKAGDQKRSLSEQMSPAHRRVAVSTKSFDVNGQHRAFLSEIFGCYQSVLDRSGKLLEVQRVATLQSEASYAIGSDIATADISSGARVFGRVCLRCKQT